MTLRACLVACGVTFATACQSVPEYHKLSPNAWGLAADSSRVVKSSPIKLSPSFFLTLPSDSIHYSMERSIDLAVGTWGAKCVVAVADRVDRAVHLFAADGEYQATIFGGGRDTSNFDGIFSVALSHGRLGIGDLVKRGVWLVDENGNIRFVPLPSPVAPEPRRFAFALGKAALYELWPGQNGKSSAHWPDLGIPTVRIVSLEGAGAGGFGSLRPFPGRAFTGALNVGRLKLYRDTLWLGDAASATVVAYPLEGAPQSEAPRQLHLPIFRSPRAALELHGPAQDDAEALVEYQLLTFVMAPGGEFFTIQATSYPEYSPAGASFVPEVVVAAVSADGKLIGTYELGARPVALAVTRAFVFAIVADSGRGRTRVVAFPNPLSETSLLGVRTHDESCDP